MKIDKIQITKYFCAFSVIDWTKSFFVGARAHRNAISQLQQQKFVVPILRGRRDSERADNNRRVNVLAKHMQMGAAFVNIINRETSVHFDEDMFFSCVLYGHRRRVFCPARSFPRAFS